MQFRIPVKQIILRNIFILIAGIVVLASLLYAVIESNGKDIPVLEIQAPTVVPIRLKIPKLNIVAEVEHVGLTLDGSMDTPEKVGNVGWYIHSARPGDAGVAVIAGHFGEIQGVPSVFDDLHTLSLGDVIYSIDDMETESRFVVTEIKRYHPEENTSEVFNSYDARAHLNLITCDGAWDNFAQSYSERLVIFSVKE